MRKIDKDLVIKNLRLDLDIALYKLGEALKVGYFEPDHYKNINNKLQELRDRQETNYT